MNDFIAKYQDQLNGTLSGFDRLVFSGTLWKDRLTGMKGYLWAHGLAANGNETELVRRLNCSRTRAGPPHRRSCRTCVRPLCMRCERSVVVEESTRHAETQGSHAMAVVDPEQVVRFEQPTLGSANNNRVSPEMAFQHASAPPRSPCFMIVRTEAKASVSRCADSRIAPSAPSARAS